MATVSHPSQPIPRSTNPEASGYWMFDRRTDMRWLILSVILPLVLYLPPYWIAGSASVWPLYLVYVVGFATPHLWMTWAVTLPPSAHGMYTPRSLWLPMAATLCMVALVPLCHALNDWDLLFTAVTMVGVYHIFKQHLGFLKIYDAKYAQIHGDRSIHQDLVPFHRLCTLAFALPIFWVWTFPPFEVVVGIQRFTLLYPQIPVWALLPYLAVMAVFGVQAVMALRARHRAGKPLPTSHLWLAGAAGLSYLAAFGLVPPRDYLLTLAIFITYHDLQYIGFVWNFHRRRSAFEAARGTPLDRVHRWALDDRLAPYLGLAALFTLAVVGLLMIAPPMLALGLVVFVNMIHYLMDGMVWKRRHYPKIYDHLGVG